MIELKRAPSFWMLQFVLNAIFSRFTIFSALPSTRAMTTCPGFPGYCSESFPGQTCVVVCSKGRNNVPLCQASAWVTQDDVLWTKLLPKLLNYLEFHFQCLPSRITKGVEGIVTSEENCNLHSPWTVRLLIGIREMRPLYLSICATSRNCSGAKMLLH